MTYVYPKAMRDAKGIVRRHGTDKAVKVARALYESETGSAASHAYVVLQAVIMLCQKGAANHA